MSTAVVRPLTSDDIDEVRALDELVHGTPWTRRSFADQVDREDRIHLVAVDDRGRMIGHAGAWIDRHIGRVLNLAVDPAQRGRGLGSTLLASLLAAMVERWRPEIIGLEVRADNHAAQSLYRSFGFAPVGMRRRFYPKGPEGQSRDALVMRLDCPSEPSALGWAP